MPEKAEIYPIGGNGKLIRIPSICIITNGDGGVNLLGEIYEHVKLDIPKEVAKRYAYSGQGQLNLPLTEESPGYRYVMEMSERYHLHPTVIQKVFYTKSEEEKADFFEMRILSPLEIEGTNAADYGTQYEGGCSNPTCRLGKHLVGDVLLDRKFLNQKKLDIGTLRPDIYVSEKLRNIINGAALTGVSFEHEVKDYMGRKMPKLYILTVQNILPRMSNTTWLREECEHLRYKECGHQVVFLRSDVQYEKEKLAGAADFNLSCEYVDNFRLQVIIVSAKVRKLFRQHKIHVGFFPVAII